MGTRTFVLGQGDSKGALLAEDWGSKLEQFHRRESVTVQQGLRERG